METKLSLTPNQLRGINFAVSFTLHVLKKDDKLLRCLVLDSAEALHARQLAYPIESAMLTVDEFVKTDDSYAHYCKDFERDEAAGFSGVAFHV